MLVCGWEKFLHALAYLFCLALPGCCLIKFANLLAYLCIPSWKKVGSFRKRNKHYVPNLNKSPPTIHTYDIDRQKSNFLGGKYNGPWPWRILLHPMFWSFYSVTSSPKGSVVPFACKATLALDHYIIVKHAFLVSSHPHVLCAKWESFYNVQRRSHWHWVRRCTVGRFCEWTHRLLAL